MQQSTPERNQLFCYLGIFFRNLRENLRRYCNFMLFWTWSGFLMLWEFGSCRQRDCKAFEKLNFFDCFSGILRADSGKDFNAVEVLWVRLLGKVSYLVQKIYMILRCSVSRFFVNETLQWHNLQLGWLSLSNFLEDQSSNFNILFNWTYLTILMIIIQPFWGSYTFNLEIIWKLLNIFIRRSFTYQYKN